MDERQADAAASARHARRVARLETFAQASPRLYLCCVVALALAGYGFLVGLLLLALAVPALVAWRVLVQGAAFEPQLVIALLLPGIAAAALLRGMWLRLGAPEGVRLGADEAPALQAEVERLRRASGAPPLAGIVVDTQLNAAAASVPRLLGLGGHRHYLVLGLPLLQLLDRDEAAAVIAHEFGHFGEAHGRLGAWLYRVRLTWYRVVEGLSRSGSPFSLPIAAFYRWYAPLFDAWSFVLARTHEYRADAIAARITGGAAMAAALLRLEHGSGRWNATLWPRLLARARVQRHPPAQLLAPLVDGLRGGARPDLPRLLAIAARQADPFDTHPTLARRIEALGVTPQLPAGGEAAASWLGGDLERIAQRLDRQWREQLRPDWQALHDAAAADRARFAALDGQRSLSVDEAVEHARLFELLEIDHDPIPVHARALAANPASAHTAFRLGVLRLRAGDPAGVADLRQAVAHDAGAVGPVCEAIEALLRDPDVGIAAADAAGALRDALGPQARDLAERAGSAEGDDLQAHDLDTAALRRLTDVLAAHPRIASAWLVRKSVAMATQAHYVLLLDWRGSIASETAGLRAVSEALSLPGSHTVFTGSDAAALAKQLRRVAGAPVYRKGQHARS